MRAHGCRTHHIPARSTAHASHGIVSVLEFIVVAPCDLERFIQLPAVTPVSRLTVGLNLECAARLVCGTHHRTEPSESRPLSLGVGADQRRSIGNRPSIEATSLSGRSATWRSRTLESTTRTCKKSSIQRCLMWKAKPEPIRSMMPFWSNPSCFCIETNARELRIL